jgi:acyl-coenzyme A thioesterase PaaI-like protein
MTRTQKLIHLAEKGGWALWLLNRLLWRVIPFNLPHKPTIRTINPDEVKTTMRLTRANQNHLKGMHACALATLTEYTCGLLILRKFGGKYRIIMKSIKVDYHVQCRTDAHAAYRFPPEILRTMTETSDWHSGVDIPCKIDVLDEIGQTVCTATILWQVKDMAW